MYAVPELPDPPEQAVKSALRARFLQYRAGLGAAEYERLSRAIAARVAALPELAAARTIHVYWPRVLAREVDLRALVAALHAQKKQIVLPVVRTFGRAAGGAGRLEHLRFTGEAALRANKWGILEPSGGQTVPLEEIDLVIVPALGAGRNGHRIGHGLGYYDEFLAGLAVPRVGPVYAACLVASVPAEPHDVPLTAVVTEREVVRPGVNVAM